MRHRLCAFSQESTRYVKYSGDVQVIEPFWYKRATDAQRNLLCNLYAKEVFETMFDNIATDEWAKMSNEALTSVLNENP